MRNIMQDSKSKAIETSSVGEFDRRDFLKLLGGGIIIFFSVESPAQGPMGFGGGFGPGGGMGGFPGMGGGQSDLNAYLKIGEDGKVTVFSGKIEQGQANTTALAQMAAEELMVSLDSVQMIMGDTDLCPYDMGTFGSMSIRVYGASLRAAAAEARTILVDMAAEQLKIPADQLKVENGVIYSAADKKSQVSFAQLAKGQKITRKLGKQAALRSASEFTIIGKSPMRFDAVPKVTGKAQFTGDLRFPDLHYAKILRPPSHASKIKSVDTSAAEKIPGVLVVNEGGLTAVLHPDPEIAEKARAAIKAEFDIPNETIDEKSIFDELLKKAPRPSLTERKGDLAAGEKAAVKTFEHTYLNGYGAHASIETHTACAKIDGNKITLWISTQTPFTAQSEISRAIGMSARVITPYVGGGFGGKSSNGQATEAARLAKITGKPVQVSYNRDEEFFYDAFRPAAIVKIKSGIDANGKICLWDYHVYFAGTRGAEKEFYDIPNHLVSSYGNWMAMPGSSSVHPFATGAWRAPGANINVFARESQIDIMAAELKMDPLEFRLKNTSNPQMRRALESVAQRFGYKPAPAPSRRGIGIACGIDDYTFVAEIAEVTVDKGNVKVKRVFATQDMGISVNPEGSKMQMEGCIMMGLGYTLSEDISYKGTRLFTTNFHNYKIPRFSWLPQIDAFVIKNDEAPKGGGEPAIIPVGGAVANAIYDAIGARLFQMPMTPERINNAPKI
jgi:nicotinate dehydrogenase subunit B